MIACLYNTYFPEFSKEKDPPCQNEARWLNCGVSNLPVCDKHRCRCKIAIVECSCKGDFSHCPMCKGEGWCRVR